MKFNFQHTRYACYIGYVTQAIINNLAPLFFIIFSENYSVSYRGLGSLVMINFMTQLIVDAACIKIASRIGYKTLLVTAHIIAAIGLVLLGILPLFISPVFLALVISIVIFAIGGGLLEVLISPVVDSLPEEAAKKPASMSLLHSFYCWGQMAVILLTTFLLLQFGRENWFFLPILWAIIPLLNTFLFLNVPLIPALKEKDSMGIKEMARNPVFFLCLLMMLSAGASEQSVAQWASLFAERALNLPKIIGDIFGPALFALFMGIGRTIYGLFGSKIKIYPYMLFSVILCILCYLGISFAPHPLIQLAACALTGFSISIMWPAVFSISSSSFPKGGAPLFALLALMGDLGCGTGPWIAGFVSDAQGSLGTGIFVCILFPFIFLFSLLIFKRAGIKRAIRRV